MKKIKTYFIIFSVFLMATTFVSCNQNSFLQENLYSAYAPSTLSDSLGLEASLVGLYYQLSTWYTFSSGQGWPCVWQVGTDVAYSTPNQQGIEIPYYDYNKLISTDWAAWQAWDFEYNLISNCNNIISTVESNKVTGMSQTGKNEVDAEARFFRAYSYNILATLYGGVPLIKKPVTGPKTNFTRAPLDSVNAFIIQDLQYAVKWLPDCNHTINQERVSKAVAEQELATVDCRTKNWDDAITQCDNIINSGNYSLVTQRYGIDASEPGDPFSDMFIFGNERRSQGNTEAIWVLQQQNPSNVVGGSSGWPQQRRCWVPAYYQITGLTICDSLDGRGLGRMRLDNWVLYHLYPKGDMRDSRFNIRRHYWYNNPSSPLYGQMVPYQGYDTVFRICPSTTKWGQFDPNDVFGYGMWKDYILMRLGGTYLLRAEAECFKGDNAAAANDINVLRTRAHAPLVTAAQINPNFILDERARELLAEENRRLTLMRFNQEVGYNILVARAERLNGNPNIPHPLAGLPDSTSKAKEFLPIPQNEIDLNKDATLTQNPGY